jgi:hypothetical protein
MCQIIKKIIGTHLRSLKNNDENSSESTSARHDSTNSKSGQICDTLLSQHETSNAFMMI